MAGVAGEISDMLSGGSGEALLNCCTGGRIDLTHHLGYAGCLGCWRVKHSCLMVPMADSADAAGVLMLLSVTYSDYVIDQYENVKLAHTRKHEHLWAWVGGPAATVVLLEQIPLHWPMAECSLHAASPHPGSLPVPWPPLVPP